MKNIEKIAKSILKEAISSSGKMTMNVAMSRSDFKDERVFDAIINYLGYVEKQRENVKQIIIPRGTKLEVGFK